MLYITDTNNVTFTNLIYADVFLSPGIETPPVMATQPTNQAVLEGWPAVFTVACTGTTPMSYCWLLNGQNIYGPNSNTFTLSSTRRGDSGNYSVIVTNVAGAVTSSVASLAVTSVEVTSPAAKTWLTNTAATVIDIAGTVSNPAPVTGVWWQLNTSGWNLAGTSDSWAHWSGGAAAPWLGSNVLQVYSTDSANRHSLTTRVSFVYFQNFTLTLATNGHGGITQTPKGTVFSSGT